MIPARGHPIIAAVYDRLLGPAEREFLGAHRESIVGAAAGRILDVGVGTGLNIPHYRVAASVVGVDPDPYMLRRAVRRRDRLGRRVELLAADGEALPFADASFDSAVATLVLCTVADPGRALGELRRVLRPGGRLHFIEHVRARSGGWRRFQDAVTPVWRRIAAGCHPNRDTVAAIAAAGFTIVALAGEEFGPYPTRPFVRGTAVAPG
jgi:ubiquinone/menaquinone biosynthesis C-methylase UbiE